MTLLALVRPAPSLEVASALLSKEAGLALAEARMRLSPEPPALLVRVAPEKAPQIIATLRQAGLSILGLQLPVPTDAERTLVRDFKLTSDAVHFVPRAGAELTIPWSEVAVILRAMSTTRSSSEETRESTRFAPGAAILSGGLKVSKKVTETVRTEKSGTEQAVFVYDREGRCAVMREAVVNFACLGPRMQPVRTANMAMLAAVLRENAPRAYFDERLVRLGTRSLPFILGGETHIRTGTGSAVHKNTAVSVDVLAEVLHQAVREKLLP